MSELVGYNKVAVIKQGIYDYHYAVYDDDLKAGDNVLVSGNYLGNPIHRIDEIIPLEVAKERFSKAITAEVICKVDLSSYEIRVSRRKEAERIKKEMDKKIKEMQEYDKYSMYAERNPELAELLNNYNRLTC